MPDLLLIGGHHRHDAGAVGARFTIHQLADGFDPADKITHVVTNGQTASNPRSWRHCRTSR